MTPSEFPARFGDRPVAIRPLKDKQKLGTESWITGQIYACANPGNMNTARKMVAEFQSTLVDIRDRPETDCWAEWEARYEAS